MKPAYLPLALLLAAPSAFCAEPWYRPASSDIVIPAASEPLNILGGCPKVRSIKAGQEYAEPPAVREVSEVGAQYLPPPADDLDRAGITAILRTDLEYWNAKPDSASVQVAGDRYDAPRMRRTIKALIDIFASDLTPAQLQKALKDGFKIYRASADDGTGKTVITGYYEAEIPVTRERDAEHKYPVLLRPADLVKTTADMGVDFDYGRYDGNGEMVKHFSTQEIHAGALDGRGLELVWSAHPAQIMLMQIQGSGVLRFPDGDFIRAGFDGANGHPFRSVQRILMDCGEIESMSFKNFISYLTSQGDREERLIDLNPRYIYFEQRPKESSASGAIGKPLVPGRSIAVDPKYIPYGLFGLLKSRRPVAQADGLSFSDFARFISTHDTGSAIRGPGRVDLFWGSGGTAETEASSMKASGELYLFVIK